MKPTGPRPPGHDRLSLTPKQEAFAQCIVAGKTQADAYREAYGGNYKPAALYVKASHLIATPKIKNRIAELRAPAAAAAGLTLEKHLEDLQTLRNLAVKKGNYSAAVQAEIARGRAAGVQAPEKKTLALTGPDGGPLQLESKLDVGSLTDDQLRVLASIPVRAG